MVSFAIFRVSWWGRLHLLCKISRVYVTASRLCEHSNLVRFDKRASKTPQHGLRYGNILMLCDIVNTYQWFLSAIIDTNVVVITDYQTFPSYTISGKIHYLNIKHELALTPSPFRLICNKRCRRTQEREPTHTQQYPATQRYQISQYFEIGPRQYWFISRFRRRCSLWCSTDSCGQVSYIIFWLFVFFSAHLLI